MPSDTIEVRVLLRHYRKKGLSVRKAAEEINKGKGATNKSAAGRWFQRFNVGNFDLEDKPRSGRPTKLDNDDLLAVLEDEPSLSAREVATEHGVSHTAVLTHLHQLKFVHKKPRQDPHQLTEAQANKRVEICRQLLDNPLNDRL
jgi:histone-lysine N-methyltransferase SETMAR